MADNFKFGVDKNIIVALEHNVLMANKKDLAKVRHFMRRHRVRDTRKGWR